jgi:Family of unknown function (DUF6353)
MNLSSLLTKGLQTVKSNSPEILTGFSIAGLGITAYLSGKAAVKASEVIKYHDANSKKELDWKQKFGLVWKIYLPVGVSGLVTAGCIIGSSRASSHRTAAALSAYTLTEKAFTEYRTKVAEEIGKNKERKVRDEIAQDRVTDDTTSSKEIVMWGFGEVVCCEMYTHRYFKSDMESLRKAENKINSKINNHLYVTLDEFYDIVGLPHTSISDQVGWNSDKGLMELHFTTVLMEGTPCLAFDYNYVRPLR